MSTSVALCMFTCNLFNFYIMGSVLLKNTKIVSTLSMCAETHYTNNEAMQDQTKKEKYSSRCTVSIYVYEIGELISSEHALTSCTQ